MKKIRLLLCSLFFCAIAFAQTRQVTGVVRDAATNQPVISATVAVKDRSINTAADADGRFSLNVPTGRVTLQVSSTGYTTRAVEVGANESSVVITLTQGTGEMNEVVVTALGIRKERKALAYSVSEVKGEELTKARTNNLVNGLEGKVAGLNVVTTATGAGGSSRVVLRGNTSLNGGNQPLYVVDGIPIDNSNRGSAGEWGGRDAGDGIQMLNPDEIETISVLKGGQAAALYGSRASNGVILITTKKGSQRKGVGIEVNSNFVAEKVINLTDWQYQYGHGVNGKAPATADEAASINFNSWGGKLDGSSVFQYDGVQRPYIAQRDNLKKFYRTGTNFTNSVSLYGGSDKMTYNFTLSDLDNKSTIPNSSLRRDNISLNTTFQPVDKLSVNVSVRFIRERVKNRTRLSDSPGNPNFTVGLMPTSLDVLTFKNSMVDANGGEVKFNGNDYVTNPYWAVNMFQQHDERDRIIGSIEGRYNFTKWLYVRGRIGTDEYVRTNFEVTPTGTRYSPGGQINDQTTNKFREFNGEWLVGVQKEIAKFGVDAFVGGNAMIRKDEGQSFSGDNFFAPGFYNVNNLQTKNTSYNYAEQRINSLFGSAELSYDRLLYVTATLRNDWFSSLSPQNWSLLYPSVGASFLLSNALRLPSAFDYAKVRASWAKVGGDRDPYGLTLQYGLNSNSYGNLPVGGISSGTIPNRNLLPYKVTTQEAGFETRLLKNRLGIDFTYYIKKTTDDIVASQISGTTGYGSVLLNVGEISNKGVELLLTGRPIQSKKFSWDLSFNMGYNKSEVVRISDQLTTARIAQARSLTAYVDQIVGKPYGQVMAFDFKRSAKGELILVDGLPQRGDLKPYGTGVAPYTLGLTNDFRFGSFSLNVLVDGKFGGVMYSGTNDFGTYRGLTQETLRGREGGIVETGVTAAGAPNTTNVTAQSYFQSIALNISSPFVYKSDFIKLRQIILAYQLAPRFITHTPFKGITVSLVGRNLAILKKYVPNVDPESTYNSGNGQGLEWYGAPPIRSFGINANLRF